MTPIITDYPVFEADQVLSQTHLNKLIGYLEEQDRMSRIALLGMGIVCGLDITRPNATTVHLSCGTAITSLGFIIPFEDSGYTHYKATNISEHFLHPDLEKHPYLQSLYDHASAYVDFENCLELLPSDSTDPSKAVLSEAVLDDKVIMLLLEVPLIDLKNCTATNCDDRGKKIAFNARPLLIDREQLEDSNILLNQCQNTYFQKKLLPKYNVPSTRLVTGYQVLEAFNSQILKGKQLLHNAVKSVHDHYQQDLGSLANYSKLGNLQTSINALHSQFKNDIYIQYVADWMADLLATYQEISEFNTCNPSICCPNDNLFPFHVLLGLAEFETKDIEAENELYRFRTPFIKTGILAEAEKEKKATLEGLINKLIHQISVFDIHLKTVREEGIKITPSQIGNHPLSERAIPYYYGDIKKLVNYWSPQLKIKGLQNQLLSYHSKQYNNANDHVNNPLQYDCEPYDFYRIEGHIGKSYTEALATVISQVNQNRLPFKVIALNASDYYNKTVDISKHIGDWNDLELDYDMARKKVFNITQYVVNWIEKNKTEIQKNYAAMTDSVIARLTTILSQTQDLLSDDLQEFLYGYEDFYDVFEGLNNLFVLHRACVLAINQENLNQIEEDLIDHFDEINMLFLEDPFTVIVEEANKRWTEEYQNLFLAKFLESHPGISHKAGVSKDGTFIMVYVDSSIFAKPKPQISQVAGLIGLINTNMLIFDYSADEAAEIISVNAHVKPRKTKEVKEPTECEEEVKQVKAQWLANIQANLGSDLPFSVQDYIYNNVAHIIDYSAFGSFAVPNNRRIPERVVIADFYLPYICCSNGNTINIVLPPNEETETTIADFDHRDFNDDDFFTNKPE